MKSFAVKAVVILASLTLFVALRCLWCYRGSDPYWVGRDWGSEWPDASGQIRNGADTIIVDDGRLVYHRIDFATADPRLHAGQGTYLRHYGLPFRSKSFLPATAAGLWDGARIHFSWAGAQVVTRRLLGFAFQSRTGPSVAYKLGDPSVSATEQISSIDISIPMAVPTFAAVLPAAWLILAGILKRPNRTGGFDVVGTGAGKQQDAPANE